MLQQLRRLLLAAVIVAVGFGLLSATAHAYTVTQSGSTVTIVPSVSGGNDVPVAVSASVSGTSVVFSPAASAITQSGTGCSTSQTADTTTCPTSDYSSALEIQDAYAVSLDGVATALLTVQPADADDQITLTKASLSTGTLNLQSFGTESAPEGSVSLDATGSIETMEITNSNSTAVTDSGTLSMNLQAGATAGSISLGGGDNYVYAPQSSLGVTTLGGGSTITTGGAVNASGGSNLIHAVSTSQTINGGGNSAVDFLDMSTPLTLTMGAPSSGGTGEDVWVGTSTAATADITGVDALTGSSANDTLIAAGTSADDITGGPGNNTFQIDNSAPDQIQGGTGNDNTVDYSQQSTATALSVNLQTGTGGPCVSGTGGLTCETFASTQDTLTDIQNVITGNANQDTVTAGPDGGTFTFGSGNEDTFTGGAGNDIVTAGNGNDDSFTGGSDTSSFTVGSGQDDTLTGGSGNSYMGATGADDTFTAGFGQNTIIGGGANDTVSYANRTQSGQGVTVTLTDSGASTGNGQPGENDSITGIQNIIGGEGYNILTANSGNDMIVGGPNGNQINGGSGDDTLVGGGGNDIINAGSGNGTTIYGNGGTDIINAASGTGDNIDCGNGSSSSVTIDPSDTNVASNCTTVTDPSITTTTTTPTTPVNPCTYVLPGQTCNGTVYPYPVLKTMVLPRWTPFGTGTRAKEMLVTQIQAGSDLQMSCTSPALSNHNGCPPDITYTKNFASNAARFSLLPRFKQAKKSAGQIMLAGTKITIRITNTEAVGVYYTFQMRVSTKKKTRLPLVTSGCLNPIDGRTMACPASGEFTP